MKKHSRIILSLGVVCLTFLFILSSLFGCKLATIGQSEPEFKTVRFDYGDGTLYPIKIPGFMPDFTQFNDSDIQVVAGGLLIIINYYIPNRPPNAEGYKDHYRFIASGLEEDIPGILMLMYFDKLNIKQWIYDENENPHEVSTDDGALWLQVWLDEAHKKIWGSFEKEEKIKLISMEI